jgi:hypothetical protein
MARIHRQAARRAGVALVGFIALAAGVVGGAAQAETPCTYYAAPVEADGGRVPEGEPFAARFNVGTPDKPIAVADFWDRKLVKPGTVLCLKDGEYRGERSMIRPPPNQFAGESEARVEIRALNDGRVFLDGEFRRRPIKLAGQHYWTLAGLNAYNSAGAVVGVSGHKQTEKKDQRPTHHVILQRIVGWRDYIPYGSTADYDAIGGINSHVFDLADVSDLLVEDCAGFGWGRKIFQNYRSKRVTFRRVWARWDGRPPYVRGNKFAFSCSYKGYDAVCENLIATVGGTRDPAAHSESYAPGIHLIATDGNAEEGTRWLEPPDRDRYSIGLRIYGSLAYAPPSAFYSKVTGIRIGGATYPSKGLKGVLIEDSVAVVAKSEKVAAGLLSCDDDPEKYPNGCSWQRGDDRARSPLMLRHLTLVGVGERPAIIHQDWRQEDVRMLRWGEPVDIYRSSGRGASLCHRYIDGRETSAPLWPWPMQERIRVATQRSLWPTADVMGEITELFGAPPAECTASEGAPPAGAAPKEPKGA